MRATDDIAAGLRADARTTGVLLVFAFVLLPLALVITTLEWWHGRRA